MVHAKHAAQRSDELEDNSVYTECVDSARGIPVIANGGITSPKIVQSLMDAGVSGVMMGRPALRNPAIFDHMKNTLDLNDPPKTVPTINELKREYDDIYNAIDGSEKYRSRFLKEVGKTRLQY